MDRSQQQQQQNTQIYFLSKNLKTNTVYNPVRSPKTNWDSLTIVKRLALAMDHFMIAKFCIIFYSIACGVVELSD